MKVKLFCFEFESKEKLVCVNGDGRCSVNRGIAHRCRKCRLERCFAMGMRKDFILSDEQKQRRKQRLELNRNLATQSTTTQQTTTTDQQIDKVNYLSKRNKQMSKTNDLNLVINGS